MLIEGAGAVGINTACVVHSPDAAKKFAIRFAQN